MGRRLMSNRAEVFRRRADWLRSNMGYWAPEVFDARFAMWVNDTAEELADEDAITDEMLEYARENSTVTLDQCGKWVWWYGGEYRRQCELPTAHEGDHWDGMAWFDVQGNDKTDEHANR